MNFAAILAVAAVSTTPVPNQAFEFPVVVLTDSSVNAGTELYQKVNAAIPHCKELALLQKTDGEREDYYRKCIWEASDRSVIFISGPPGSRGMRCDQVCTSWWK